MVKAVSRDALHRFSKVPVESIRLVAGHGVEGDAHAGARVQHRSRVRRDPSQPNLRQVHLIHAELFDEARSQGFELAPGDLGENITTLGLDLLGLPLDTRVTIGEAVIRLTGLRNPCAQITTFRPGLLAVVLEKPDGTRQDTPAPATGSGRAEAVPVQRKAGVMGVVERGGTVRAGQSIRVTLPEEPHEVLRPV